MGLDKYWDAVLCTMELGCLKPSPEPFLFISQKLGINPEKIIYVGNNYIYDIIGAKNAGMLSAHFTIFKKKNSIADLSFCNYKNLGSFVFQSV